MFFGIDLVDAGFRGMHAFMAATWLILDFIVYWLHFKVKDGAAPIDERLERARVMHGIDTVVAYVFLLMFPTGVALAYITGTALWTTEWLNWKHVMYGVIVVDALYLLPISGTALKNLKAIKSGATNVGELNVEIRQRMDQAMPAVWLIWALVFAASVVSLLNLKTPQGQEYIFRKTATELTAPAR